MKTILEAFEAFGERLSPDAPFPAQDFMRVMEPVFASGGYRTSRTAGEKMQMLVIMDAGVGDFLCFSGALREIRRLYPEVAITLVIFPPGFKLAEQCPYIDFLLGNEQLPVLRPLSELFAAHAGYAAEHLLRQRFDLAFIFGHYASAYLLAYMAGAKERIGHVGDFAEGGLSREDCAALLTRPLEKPVHPLHMADLCFDVLDQMLAAPVADRSLAYFDWYNSFSESRLSSMSGDIMQQYQILGMAIDGLQKCKSRLAGDYIKRVDQLQRTIAGHVLMSAMNARRAAAAAPGNGGEDEGDGDF